MPVLGVLPSVDKVPMLRGIPNIREFLIHNLISIIHPFFLGRHPLKTMPHLVLITNILQVLFILPITIVLALAIIIIIRHRLTNNRLLEPISITTRVQFNISNFNSIHRSSTRRMMRITITPTVSSSRCLQGAWLARLWAAASAETLLAPILNPPHIIINIIIIKTTKVDLLFECFTQLSRPLFWFLPLDLVQINCYPRLQLHGSASSNWSKPCLPNTASNCPSVQVALYIPNLIE